MRTKCHNATGLCCKHDASIGKAACHILRSYRRGNRIHLVYLQRIAERRELIAGGIIDHEGGFVTPSDPLDGLILRRAEATTAVHWSRIAVWIQADNAASSNICDE